MYLYCLVGFVEVFGYNQLSFLEPLLCLASYYPERGRERGREREREGERGREREREGEREGGRERGGKEKEIELYVMQS